MSTPINPADIAAVQATDALLDRLALGTTTADDREDSLVEALVGLRTTLEASGGDPGVDIARLLEVLGDRPLYLVDGEENDAAAELPIHLGRAAEADGRLVVDLTELAASSPDGLPEPSLEPVAEPVGLAAFTARAARVADQLREKAPGHALLPAASVIALLVLGLSSGVSGVVTGDPMAPVSGVGRVLSALPGVSSDGPTVEDVTASVKLADQTVQQDPGKASALLADAQKKVDDLPVDQQATVNRQIAEVVAKLPPGTAQNPAASATPVPSGQPSATPDASPSASPTDPSSSPSVSVTPTPSAAESTDSSGSGSSALTTS